MIKKPRLEILYPNTPFSIKNYPLKLKIAMIFYIAYNISYGDLSII